MCGRGDLAYPRNPDNPMPEAVPQVKPKRLRLATSSSLWQVGPISNLGSSLFDSAEVRFNDTVVFGGQTGFAYRAMFNTLLDTDKITDEELQCGMFLKDTVGFVDDVDLTSEGNKGFAQRAELMEGSKSVELLSRLQIDAFKTDKYLIS